MAKTPYLFSLPRTFTISNYAADITFSYQHQERFKFEAIEGKLLSERAVDGQLSS